MLSKQDIVKNIIEDCTSNLYSTIEHWTDVNQPVKILGDQMTEVIDAVIHDTRCSGTAGSGWDTRDCGESKFSSHVQSRKCLDCGSKVTFFSSKCLDCNSTNLSKNPRDGRWGIDSKSHFKHFENLKEYRLTLLEPKTDEPSCRKFRIRNWIIKKDSEYLNEYAKAQFESPKSKHINFQPLKADFYLSKPVLIYDGQLTIEKESSTMEFDYFDVNNNTPVDLPVEFVGINIKERLEKKSFGKSRGKTKRI